MYIQIYIQIIGKSDDLHNVYKISLNSLTTYYSFQCRTNIILNRINSWAKTEMSNEIMDLENLAPSPITLNVSLCCIDFSHDL